jgi:hypothetical protein
MDLPITADVLFVVVMGRKNVIVIQIPGILLKNYVLIKELMLKLPIFATEVLIIFVLISELDVLLVLLLNLTTILSLLMT